MSDKNQYPTPHDVPSPPTSSLWDDLLRWTVFVINKDDPQRQFAASCLMWAIKSGGLTDKQSAACSKMVSRIMALYDANALDCQSEHPTELRVSPSNKAGMH